MAKFDDNNYEVTKNGTVAVVKYNDEKAFYVDTELTQKTIREVFNHASNYINEATTAAAEQAESIMKEDKAIDKVVVEYPYGVSKSGNVTVSANRSQTFKIPGKDEEITKSTIAVSIKDPLTKVSKSKINKLKAQLTESLLS